MAINTERPDNQASSRAGAAVLRHRQPNPRHPDGRAVIVHSRDAGVQFGYLDHFQAPRSISRTHGRCGRWTAAKGGTLLDCATHGVSAGKFSTVASAVIVIGACAIIDCTSDAVKSLEAAKWA